MFVNTRMDGLVFRVEEKKYEPVFILFYFPSLRVYASPIVFFFSPVKKRELRPESFVFYTNFALTLRRSSVRRGEARRGVLV